MPPKPKPKKGGLSDVKIATTVNIVKQYWPNYEISIQNIRNPTREFMLNFYTECVNNLEEKCVFVSRSNVVSYSPGLSDEELLFLKLSRIPSLANADFKLGDLYVFDPKRVNNHIFVTMHFLIFTETIMDDMVNTCNSVFNTKETMSKNEEELKQLREEKTQKQINLTLLKTENKKMKELAASIAPKYDETLALIEESEKKCKEFIFEAEKCKSELEIQQNNLEKLEKTEQYLQDQVVTEEEFNNLKGILDSLKREEQSLEQIDLSNGLLEEKQHIEQLQMCLQELNHLELREELLELFDLRVQLKKEQQSLEHAIALQQSDETELEQLKTQWQTQKQLAQTENEKLQTTLKRKMEVIMLEEATVKKNYQQATKTCLNQIVELNNTIAQIEADQEKVKKAFQEKYESVCKIQDRALDRFEAFINKILIKNTTLN